MADSTPFAGAGGCYPSPRVCVTERPSPTRGPVTAHAVSPVPSEADSPPAASPRPRLWLPVTLIALYWAYVAVSAAIDMPTFTRFMSQSAALLVVMLVFIAWWVFNRRVGRRDRLLVLVAAVASVVLGQWLSHKSLGPLSVIYGLPIHAGQPGKATAAVPTGLAGKHDTEARNSETKTNQKKEAQTGSFVSCLLLGICCFFRISVVPAN